MPKVELTKSEAELFKKFKKHKEDFEILLKGEVMNFKGGAAHIHRDADGNIREIEIENNTYRDGENP